MEQLISQILKAEVILKDKFSKINENEDDILKKMETLEFQFNIEETKKSREGNLMSQVLFGMIEKQDEVSSWHWHTNLIKMEKQDIEQLHKQLTKALKAMQFKLLERKKMKEVHEKMQRSLAEQILSTSLGR